MGFADYIDSQLPLQPTPWPRPGLRRLSLNSFGYGGSNVHAVLEVGMQTFVA